MLRYSFGCDCSFVFVGVSFYLLLCLFAGQVALFQWVGEVLGPAAGNSWVRCDRAAFSTSLHQHHHHHHHHFTNTTTSPTPPLHQRHHYHHFTSIIITTLLFSCPGQLNVNIIDIELPWTTWPCQWLSHKVTKTKTYRERFGALVT